MRYRIERLATHLRGQHQFAAKSHTHAVQDSWAMAMACEALGKPCTQGDTGMGVRGAGVGAHPPTRSQRLGPPTAADGMEKDVARSAGRFTSTVSHPINGISRRLRAARSAPGIALGIRDPKHMAAHARFRDTPIRYTAPYSCTRALIAQCRHMRKKVIRRRSVSTVAQPTLCRTVRWFSRTRARRLPAALGAARTPWRARAETLRSHLRRSCEVCRSALGRATASRICLRRTGCSRV